MFNVSLSFLNGIVTAYPFPFYFLVSPCTPYEASLKISASRSELAGQRLASVCCA